MNERKFCQGICQGICQVARAHRRRVGWLVPFPPSETKPCEHLTPGAVVP